MRIANSFTEGEVQVLDFIVQTLLRGGSPAVVTRNKDFASVCRKIQGMKAKVAAEEARAAEAEKAKAAGKDVAPAAPDSEPPEVELEVAVTLQ